MNTYRFQCLHHICFRYSGVSLPSKMKITSYFGEAVRSLAIFRFLLFDNCTLIIEAKTPSQWKPQLYEAPDSERYGSSHFDMLSANIPVHAKGSNSKFRVKKLAVDLNNNAEGRMAKLLGGKADGSQKTLITPGMKFDANMLGVDPLTSGITFGKKRTGGIFGHFFHDLSPVVKEMVMGRYIANKKMIQEYGALKPKAARDAKSRKKDNFQPKTSLSMLRKKIEKAAEQADYDRGTDSEAQMVEEVFIFARTIDRYAVPLQRLWRIRSLKIAKRTIWRRNWAVLIIQRNLRAAYGRRYVKLLKKLAPIAATRIQRCWAKLLSRRRTAIFQTMVYRLTRKVLPKMKKFLKNCFLSWIEKRRASSIKIQSVIMMYSGKVRKFRRAGMKSFLILKSFFLCAFTPCVPFFVFHSSFPFCVLSGEKYLMHPEKFHIAATYIQKFFRGYRGRISLAPLIESMLIEKVDRPSARCIQRIQRGRIAKRVAAQKRLERDMAIKIQERVKYFLYRCWRIKFVEERRIFQAARNIQRM